MRRALARALAWFLRAPRGDDEPDLASIKRALVIRVDERVGNVLLTLPMIKRLRDAIPGVRVDVLVAWSKQQLVDPELAQVIPLEKRDAFRRPLRFLRALSRLRAARYDLVIDASHWHAFSSTSALLALWTRARIRILHDRGDAGSFATHLIEAPADPEPDALTKIRLLAPLGIDVESGESHLFSHLGLDEPSRTEAAKWLKERGISRFAAVLPGARKPTHRMPKTALLEAIRVLGEHDLTPVIFWGPREVELAKELSAQSGVELAPDTSLEALAAFLRRATVVIANDTGTTHLAVALGAPTIAVFTQPDHIRFGHDHPPHRVVAAHGLGEAEVAEALRRAVTEVLEESVDRRP